MTMPRCEYQENEVPPASEAFVLWMGRTTHPSAVHTPRAHVHNMICKGGWIPSDEWWLHCGTCRPERKS